MTEDIHSAINAVMATVGYVQKEKKQGLNYSFASEKALIEAIRPEMVKNGIHMFVSAIYDTRRDSYETKGGSTMNTTFITGQVCFSHTPSNTYINVVALGEGADVGDKSSPKAMTSMFKYALRQTFLIETGDDPDNTSSETQQRAAKPQQPKPSAPPAESAPKVSQKAWMKEANLAAKAAGTSIKETLKLGDNTNLLIELENWQKGNGYTDDEAGEEFKKLLPVAAEA